jgi:hypothetical protein
MQKLIFYLIVFFVFFAGCSFVYDLWPVQIPDDVLSYLTIDRNSVGWPSIGKLRSLREKVISKNILVQTDLVYRMDLDKKLYDRAIDQANFNITQAEQERMSMVGTIQNPGWLLSFLLPAAGVSAGLGIGRLKWYTEDELKSKIDEVSKQNS